MNILKDLTKGKVLPVLLYFGLPIMFGRIFQLFYSIADTRIVGSFLGDDALAAVSATSTIYQCLLCFITGLCSGFGIMTARAYGARCRSELEYGITHSFILAPSIAGIMMITAYIFLGPLLHFMNIPQDIFTDSTAYIRWVLPGLLMAALYHTCSNTLYAVGDFLTPLAFLFLSTVLNIGLDYYLVGMAQMGVQGAACATVISQGASGICCLIWIILQHPELHVQRSAWTIQKNICSELLKTGVSMGLMNSIINIGSVILQTSINSFGPVYIVAHTAARRISEILMMPFVSIGSAMATFTSQNLGAGKTKRIHSGIRSSIILLWGWCVLVLFIAYTNSPALIRFITSTGNQAVLDTGTIYMKFNTLFYFLLPVIMVLRNSLQSLGDRKTPVVSSGIECLGKILITLFLTSPMGYWAIIICEPLTWVFMVIPLLLSIRRLLPAE